MVVRDGGVRGIVLRLEKLNKITINGNRVLPKVAQILSMFQKQLQMNR